MAAKKKSVPGDQAMRDIMKRYPGRGSGSDFKGQTLRSYVSGFQDVVASSGLVDKYPKSVLDKAAAKVATQRFQSYGAGSEEARMKRKSQPTTKGRKK